VHRGRGDPEREGGDRGGLMTPHLEMLNSMAQSEAQEEQTSNIGWRSEGEGGKRAMSSAKRRAEGREGIDIEEEPTRSARGSIKILKRRGESIEP
jgi:hypothetical protein